METPKYLYHYTKFESCLEIINSGSLKLFDSLRQKDDFEIRYSGNYAFDIILNEIKQNAYKYSKEMVRAFIFSLLFISRYFTDNIKKEIVKSSMLQVGSNVDFNAFYQHLKLRDLRFFIASFSDSYKNEYLWENYAEKGQGLVFAFETNNLPSSVGLKEVHYINEEHHKYVNGVLFDYISNKANNSNEFFFQYLKEFSHVCLATKRIEFQKEKEYRLIESFDSGIDIKSKIHNHGFRDYVLLPINEGDFIKRIKTIYYTDILAEEQIKKLIEISKEYKINICKISYLAHSKYFLN
jgi:hypothetical protein